MLDNYDPLTVLVARGLVDEVSSKLNESLELQKKVLKLESRTGEVKQSVLLKELGISPSTLKKWHDNGLTPIYRGGLVFYLLEDLHRFNY